MIHAEISSDDNFLTLRMMTDITLHTGIDVSDLIEDGKYDCRLYLSTYFDRALCQYRNLKN